MPRMRTGVMTVALVALMATGCGGGDGGAKSESPPVSLAGTTNAHGTGVAKEGLEVEADDFYFGPTFVKASANQQFTLKVKNEGKASHTFTSPDLKVDEELAPGAEKTITISAPASGFVEFHCRFHQGQGMQGAIFVG